MIDSVFDRNNVSKSGWDYAMPVLGGPTWSAVRSNLRAEDGKRTKSTAKVLGGGMLGMTAGAATGSPAAVYLGGVAGTMAGVRASQKDYMKNGKRRLLLRDGYTGSRHANNN